MGGDFINAHKYLRGRSQVDEARFFLVVPCDPQSKKVFPYIHVELPVFQLVPIASCSFAGQHQKEPGLIHLSPTH